MRFRLHWVAGLGPPDFTTPVSLIAGFGGLLAFLVFIGLAVAHLPRPYLNENVTSAAGRLGDRELSVDIGIRRARPVADTLRDVQARVRADLHRHELPDLHVNLILTTLQRDHRRELA